MSKEFEAACEALRKGEIRFDAFAVRSRNYWVAHATKILHRWKVPSDVGVDDLVQVMLLEAWMRSDTWEPGRAAFRAYLVWNAINQAKCYVHKCRGAKGGRGTSESRFPMSFTSLAHQGDDEPSQIDAIHDPRESIEQVISVKEIIDTAIVSAETTQKASALAAYKLGGYDLSLAADALFEDVFCRLTYHVRDRRHASRLIASAVASI